MIIEPTLLSCLSFSFRWSGSRAAPHLQPHWPVWHFDFVCARGCAHCCHTYCTHRALSCRYNLSTFSLHIGLHSVILYCFKVQENCWRCLFFSFSCHNQVRRAIQQMMFPNKTFYWPRHIAIAFVLLSFINLLVIFAPNILGIFGIIGRLDQPLVKGRFN